MSVVSWDYYYAAIDRGWIGLSDEYFLMCSDTTLMSCPFCGAVVALRDCYRHDEWHFPTLPPSSRQRGPLTAKAAHDRRPESADEADLRDDGGTT